MKKKKFILFPTSQIDLRTAEHIRDTYKGFEFGDHLTMIQIVIFLVFSTWAIPYANAQSNFVAICLTITFWGSIAAGLGFLGIHFVLYLWYCCALKAISRFKQNEKNKKS